MSVQIKIGKGGSFPDTTVAQNELVFWYNDDKQTHYPIPLCGSLEVAPGQTTSPPFQPVSYPALPQNVSYKCALHPDEQGLLVINNDPTGPHQTAVSPGSRVVTIDIGQGGTFGTTNVGQSDQVVWQNNDDKTHWPVPNCTGLEVAPQAVSNGTQVLSPAGGLPLAISYGCAIEGHQSERGTINVFNDFVLVSNALTLSSSSLSSPVAAATGGASPYTIVQDPKNSFITAAETAPVGGSVGVSIALTQATSAKSVQYQFNATDATGIPIKTLIAITIT